MSIITSRLTEENAYQKVLNRLKQEGELNLSEISVKEHINKGSLHRWLVAWKQAKKIGFTSRPKRIGLGIEEVYYLPDIMTIEQKLEDYLKSKNALKEGKPFFWEQFVRIAFHLGIDQRKPELKTAVENIAKKYKLRWVPGNEPPKI